MILQTAIGDYRQAVVDILVESQEIYYEFLCGEEYFDPTTKTRIHAGDRLRLIKNHFLFGRRLLWQTGMWRDSITANVVVLEYNPRIVSGWIIAGTRKLLRRRTVFWGHAWPRHGRRTTWLRDVLARLADGTIAYTESQAADLHNRMPDRPVYVAPNSLYRAPEMGVSGDAGEASFIYVGRLVAEKKPDLLIRAFATALPLLPPTSHLIIVGDGPSRANCEELASTLGIGARVKFEGHIASREVLRGLYGRALASVSPGYVGLSITQSFSFGVPMIVADNEPHAPEIEAAQEGTNAVFFKAGSVTALSKVLTDITNDSDRWRSSRQLIVDDCRRRYSAEAMAAGITRAVRGKHVS